MAKVAPLDASQQQPPAGRTGSVASASRPSDVSGGSRASNHRGSESMYPNTPSLSNSGQQHSPLSVVEVVRHEAKDIMLRTGWYDSPIAHSIRRFIRGRLFTALALVALIFALFLTEVFAVCQVGTNIELDIILTFVLCLFAFEFIGLVLTDTSYLFGFFFWADLVGTMSMAMDISYMSKDFFNTDVTKPHVTDGSTSQNIIVIRAVRAAKLGARAGRLGRGVKFFLPFLSGKDKGEKVKMAKVISNQLTNVLSTRVAFLTICIVVTLPVFTLFVYPTDDLSMDSWTTLLNRNADQYLAASGPAQAAAWTRYQTELLRFRNFYSGLNYGPFSSCIGQKQSDIDFECTPSLNGAFDGSFVEPGRKNSILVVNQDHFQALFNLSVIKQQEAVANIALIAFVIIVMCCFGLLMSSSISEIALQPLERMLSVVREHCTQIFKYTKDLNGDDDFDEHEDDHEYDDENVASEFALLEKVVAKLTGIVNLATAQQDIELNEDMDENDIMVLNYMNGAQLTQHHARQSCVRKLSRGSDEHDVKPSDSFAGAMMATIPADIIDKLESPYFDSNALTREMKVSVCTYIVVSSNGSRSWVRSNVQESHLTKFVTVCESKYPPNPFHNFGHGLDVLYSVQRFMTLIDANHFLADTSQFWLMIASIGHDIGHLGVNNQYLVETAHELAVRYNDRSPLENMHCASLFLVVSDPEANIFAQVEKDLYKEMRKGIINAILHTDVIKHNDMVKELSLLYQMNTEAFDACEPAMAIAPGSSHVQTVLNALLHTADIANPMKPFELARPLAYLCIDEFFAQGDMEKDLGIPVQMLNDREKVNRPNSQLGFLEFVIMPLVESMSLMFPQLDSLAENLGNNLAHWSDIWQEETKPGEEAITKVKARVHKAGMRCETVTRAKRGIDRGHH